MAPFIHGSYVEADVDAVEAVPAGVDAGGAEVAGGAEDAGAEDAGVLGGVGVGVGALDVGEAEVGEREADGRWLGDADALADWEVRADAEAGALAGCDVPWNDDAAALAGEDARRPAPGPGRGRRGPPGTAAPPLSRCRTGPHPWPRRPAPPPG